jgi:predicted O-methyltransferase YrrM
MHLYPNKNTLRLGTRLYRRMRYRKGHGVHSPFVFNLITKVIEESLPFYRFNEIEMERRKLHDCLEKLSYTDKRGVKEKKHTATVSAIVGQEAIKQKQGMLLFRLANYFKYKKILQIGTGVGISTLYLTSYNSDIQCISLEAVPAFADIAKRFLDSEMQATVAIHVGEYQQLLPEALTALQQVDMVYFKSKREQAHTIALFEQVLPHIHSNTCIVFDGIKATQQMRQVWKTICNHPQVTVTVDLYSMGIVFFDPKLHKRNYINYF